MIINGSVLFWRRCLSLFPCDIDITSNDTMHQNHCSDCSTDRSIRVAEHTCTGRKKNTKLWSKAVRIEVVRLDRKPAIEDTVFLKVNGLSKISTGATPALRVLVLLTFKQNCFANKKAPHRDDEHREGEDYQEGERRQLHDPASWPICLFEWRSPEPAFVYPESRDVCYTVISHSWSLKMKPTHLAS